MEAQASADETPVAGDAEAPQDEPGESQAPAEAVDDPDGQPDLKAFDWKVPDDEGFDVTDGHGKDVPEQPGGADAAQGLSADAESGGDEQSILNMLGGDAPAAGSVVPDRESAGAGLSDSDLMRMVDAPESEIPAEGSVEADLAQHGGKKEDAAKGAQATEAASDTWSGEMKSAPAKEEPKVEYDGLTPKEHQYLSDSLNLARLYFETGDTDEAMKIVNDIKKRGSADLKAQAEALLGEYPVA